MLRWLVLSLLVVIADQVTKVWAEAALAPGYPLQVLPHLDLRLAYNRGAAFSFLSDAGGWQRWLFSVLAVAVSLVLGFWLARLRSTERIMAASLSLIIGGAVGNLIDRVLHGQVVDFIDLYYDARWHWPAFNLADSAITLGVGLMLLDAFLEWRRSRRGGS